MYAGRQTADLAHTLQEALLALASQIEHGHVTMMLVPRAALVQDCNAGAPLRVWGAIADTQVCALGLLIHVPSCSIVVDEQRPWHQLPI